MSRSTRSATAGLLTLVLCLGVSTGPARADEPGPAVPTATVAPEPTETTTAQPEPTEAKPTETSTTQPEPTETTPASTTPTQTTPTTTAPATSEPVASSAPVAPVEELADLQLRVWFDKPIYQSTETITAHATVANAGTATAKQVVMNMTGNLSGVWQPFWPWGVTIEPGQTVEGTLEGQISTNEDAVHIVVDVVQHGGEQDANPEDNATSASVPVVIVRGNFRGTVFSDNNGNRAQDPGEGLTGIALQISGGIPHTDRTETTGADGTFLFHDLPVGAYYTSVESAEWYVPRMNVVVHGPDDPAVIIRAIPVVENHLNISLTFSQQSYRVGDTATALLTLTNTSTMPLSDLTAECSLSNVAPDRADEGQLRPGGDGVTVPAGTTRQYPITVPVTERAQMIGHVRLYCLVGAPPGSNPRFAWFTAAARVPGGVATRVTGTVMRVWGLRPRPDNDAPVPGVKVYLRDSISGALVVSDVTDADGRFTFCDLPVGPYSFGVVGPWQSWSGYPDFIVRADENGSPSHTVSIIPGPYQPDPGDAPSGCGGGGGGAPPPDAGPPPSPNAPPPLAATGTGVTRLALSGLLTLLIGTGLVLIARRPNGPGSRRT